jgi:hypothetical protein
MRIAAVAPFALCSLLGAPPLFSAAQPGGHFTLEAKVSVEKRPAKSCSPADVLSVELSFPAMNGTQAKPEGTFVGTSGGTSARPHVRGQYTFPGWTETRRVRHNEVE